MDDSSERELDRADPKHPIAQESERSDDIHPEVRADSALRLSRAQGLIWPMLASLVVWGVLEKSLPVFQLPPELRELTGNVSGELSDRMRMEMPVVEANNAKFSLAILAFSLGLTLTVAELQVRRQTPRALIVGPVAGFVAAAIAVLAGTAGAALMDSVRLPDHRLVKTMILQCAMLGVLGLGVGVAMAAMLFRASLWKNCIAGCLLGGLLAAFLFPILAAVLMPRMNTEFLIPEPGVGRLLWVGLPASLIGLSVTGLGKERPHRPQQ
jgi:hypothetical protein